MSADQAVLALLAGLAASRGPRQIDDLVATVVRSGVAPVSAGAALAELKSRGLVICEDQHMRINRRGSEALLAGYAAIEAALDPSPAQPQEEHCPSIPWLTTVQTEWIDAVSINYAVDPEALSRLLPDPLVPELFKGTAWVQVLMSSLRDMRPQGVGSLFGVNFYQISYRAAVRYRDADGAWRRGGYFTRSETNHEVMRAVGNHLAEFKFHDFGGAQMYMLRSGAQLTIGVDPEDGPGKLVGVFDTSGSETPPEGSVWSSLDELHEPLVECYDALGVDADSGYVFILTIDRDPWNARFVKAEQLYCEYFDEGPLGNGASRLDSVLHVTRCAYRWRPLRRVPLLGSG